MMARDNGVEPIPIDVIIRLLQRPYGNGISSSPEQMISKYDTHKKPQSSNDLNHWHISKMRRLLWIAH